MKSYFLNLFDLRGVYGRAEYGYALVLCGAILVAKSIYDFWILSAAVPMSLSRLSSSAILALGVTLVLLVVATSKRLRDLPARQWWLLLLLIPVVNVVFVLVLLLRKGNEVEAFVEA